MPGKKSSFIGYNTLWLGEDRLLWIVSNRFSEDYKRFHYGDIQSVITRKTVTGKIHNLFLGLFCAFFVLIAYLIGEEPSRFFWIIAGVFLLSLLINWFGGPTCVCNIQTAVQTVKLPSLHRLKTAQKALKRLRPLIEKAQGELSPEVLWAG